MFILWRILAKELYARALMEFFHFGTQRSTVDNNSLKARAWQRKQGPYILHVSDQLLSLSSTLFQEPL